ncbi:MAG TPA: ABC transporter ATP-binding protein, partial [Planctomycetales bacterium]|nr:ABC transporter ATP-binding protein [Planctomycetales bacterium]
MLELRDVSKSFGGTAVLRPTTLTVEPGRTTVLIGASGCGKSTLLRIMVGLIPPDTGSVRFEGEEVTPANAMALRGLDRGSVQVTDLFSTDAEIKYYHLRVLEDDLGFFPSYYAVLLSRDDLAERAPAAAE